MIACPDDDMLGALVEQALDEADAARVSEHLDGCDACRDLVVAAVRAKTPPAFPKGTPSLPGVELSAPPKSLVGTRMGRYEIRSLLGAGGMGQVFTAYDAELDREIALKVLRPELARSASVLADRLVRESRLMAKVAHSSVITVYDVGREGDAVFIAMELIRGETLAAFVARTKPGWREALATFERAGQGLAAAHAAGIVHRDFKPENVLVEGDGQKVVVTDFGVAMAAALAGVETPTPKKPSSRDAKLTATGVAIGTPAYMAPEQLDGGTVDQRADVFAFSVSLWEALFGERPFRGKNVDELRAAMRAKPKAGRTPMPARLIRALERGLAIDPAQRWPDMQALLREIVAVRSTRKRTIAIAAAGGTALVGVGIVGALVLADGKKNPCAVKPPVAPTLSIEAAAKQKLADNITAWRDTHAATCRADRDPPQSTNVVACLEARKLEIEAFIADVPQSPTKAIRLARQMVDPAKCKDPKSGHAFARVPPDAATRQAVTALRLRAFDIEDMRDRQDYTKAIEASKKLVEDAKSSWPPVLAETMYLLGTTQAMSGGPVESIDTLRQAAALGERTHHSYIAANSFIQLISSAAFDAGDPTRALEYATYADAALDSIGRPPDLEVLYLYYKGTAMIEGDRAKEAEPILRRAVEISEQAAPQYLAQATLGLGYFFEEQGRYAEAADTYRRAIKQLDASKAPLTSAHTFRERLAINLSLINENVEAETVAREAVAMAEKLNEDNVDRAIVRSTLAQVLQTIGKREEALVQARLATKTLGKIIGERNQRYGEMLTVEGSILVELEQFDEAVKTLDRACEIIAYGSGEESTMHAECLLSESIALDGLGKGKDALANVDRGIAILIAVDGEVHPRVASALVQRGLLRENIGRHAEAVADLEKAIAAFEQLQLESGHLAAATWALGKTLWKSDKPRAKKLVEASLALFDKGSPSWAQSKADAVEWLRTDGKPPAP